jgi:5-methylcytosine-specific restriction endonuclease McrA
MPKYKTPVVARKRSFNLQSGRCYYCESPIWLTDPDHFATTHRLSKQQTRSFQCTAEHLQARCDGGSDSPNNVVAACMYCNAQRHKRKDRIEPAAYRSLVQSRVRKGRWHRRMLTHAQ